MMQEEIWKDIKGFEGRYQVSNKGQVYSLLSRKILKPGWCGHMRYPIVCLYSKNGKCSKRVHKLVAEAFIPNPLGLETVNHIDENPMNNCVENLEWMSAGDNLRYSQGIKVAQIDPETNVIIRVFSSCRRCADFLGINLTTVLRRIEDGKILQNSILKKFDSLENL